MSSIDSAGPYDPKPSGARASNFLGQKHRYTTFFFAEPFICIYAYTHMMCICSFLEKLCVYAGLCICSFFEILRCVYSCFRKIFIVY